MATPTASDLATLDYAWLGQPFCRVEPSAGVHTQTLDYSWFGQPFVGASVAASASMTSTACAIMLMHRRQSAERHRKRGATRRP